MYREVLSNLSKVSQLLGDRGELNSSQSDSQSVSTIPLRAASLRANPGLVGLLSLHKLG